MEYKNYIATVEFDDEAGIFHGEVINTTDVITFQGTTPEELRRAFADSVEDYLAFCEERGEEPERPFSGKFVLRIDPELHRRLTIRARQEHKSLNAHIVAILEGTNYQASPNKVPNLLMLEGMKTEVVELLTTLGISSINELAEQEIGTLYEKAKHLNSKKNLLRKFPAKTDFEKWIQKARTVSKSTENQLA